MIFQDITNRVKDSCIAAWHILLSFVGHLRRFRNYTRRTWRGADPASGSNHHAVYVHFNPEGVVHDYVVEQLQQLVASGFRITFASNAPRLHEPSIELIRPLCKQVIWRRNRGYDFGAYKDGIAAIGDLSACDRLLLMNDSVYGPFRSLTEVFASADPNKTDVWGITDSSDGHYHIQTYFILFFKEALNSSAFREFWRRLPYVNSKLWVIRHAEMKLTKKLTQHKLRAAVLCPYWDVAKVALTKLESKSLESLPPRYKTHLEELQADIIEGRPLNPSHYFWETLINDFNCPFIKRDLIQTNPVSIADAWRWAELIRNIKSSDIELIKRHLQTL